MPPCPTTSRNHVMLISYVNIHQVTPSRTLEEKLRGRILVLVIGPKNGPRYGPWIRKVRKARSTIVSKQSTSELFSQIHVSTLTPVSMFLTDAFSGGGGTGGWVGGIGGMVKGDPTQDTLWTRTVV